jgi:Trk K+ transport system NAD-binding subunit
LTTNHSASIFQNLEKVVLIALSVLAFTLGFIGHTEYFKLQQTAVTLSDITYFTVNLFLMDFGASGKLPLSLDIARWLAPATLSYAIIKTFMSLINNKLQKYRLSHLSEHAIIIGLNKRSMNIALSFRKSGIKTVVVDEDANNRYWGELKREKVTTLVANPFDGVLHKTVNTLDAKYLFASTSSDNTNLHLIYSLLNLKNTQKTSQYLHSICQVHNSSLLNVLSDRPLFFNNHHNLSTRVVSINSLVARWLLNEYGPHTQIPNFADLATCTLAIVGDNEFTPEFLLRIAEIGVYNFSEKIHIVLLSAGASSICEGLKANYPAISDLISLEPITVDKGNVKHLQTAIQKISPNLIYVCHNEIDEKLLALQHLTDHFMDVPINVCEIDNHGSFEWLISEFSQHSSVKFIDLNNAVDDYDEIFGDGLDSIAIAIHNNYVAQQLKKGESVTQNSSLVEWDALAETLKNSNRNQADHVAIKCQYLTAKAYPSREEVKNALTPQNIASLARMEHERWVAEKKLAGWKYTASSKNALKRLSPSLIDWNSLSMDEQDKDKHTIEHLPALVELITKTRSMS